MPLNFVLNDLFCYSLRKFSKVSCISEMPFESYWFTESECEWFSLYNSTQTLQNLYSFFYYASYWETRTMCIALFICKMLECTDLQNFLSKCQDSSDTCWSLTGSLCIDSFLGLTSTVAVEKSQKGESGVNPSLSLKDRICVLLWYMIGIQ